jgi:HK97 family phage major capsid protein
MSSEVLEDSAINLYSELVNMFAIAIGQEEDRVIFNGITGSGEPEGILTNAGSSDAQSGSNLVYADLVSTLYRAPAQLRKTQALKWYLSTQALALIDNLLDDDDKPLFRERISVEKPNTLLGLTYEEQPVLPEDDGKGGDQGIIVLCDPTSYYLFDRRKMSIKTTDQSDSAFLNDQTWVKVTCRMDGRVMNPQAFTLLTEVK